MCTACVRKRRSPVPVKAQVSLLLTRREIKQALADAYPHLFVRALVDEIDLTQRTVADYTQISQSSISRYYNDPWKRASREHMLLLAEGFDVPPGMVVPDIGEALTAAPAANTAHSLRTQLLSAAAKWREKEMTLDQVDQLLADLANAAPTLQQHNDLYGGSAQLRIMADRFADMADAVCQQNLGSSRAQEAARLKGELSMLAGWLHYDGGNQAATRRYWTVALIDASVNENRAHEVYALESLSAQATYYLARPREAVDFARRAQNLHNGRESSRIRSLLELREACAWAVMNDEKQFLHHYKLAQTHLDDTDIEHDPDWIKFYGDSELKGLYALALFDLQKPKLAEPHFVTAFEAVGRGYARNRLYYGAMLAKTRLVLGDAPGAAEVVDENFLKAALDTGSLRTRNHVEAVLSLANYSRSRDAKVIRDRAREVGYLGGTE